MLALTALLPLGVTRVAASHLLARHRAHLASGLAPAQGELEWTPRAVTLYPLACVFAGVAAGLLGIGGGMIKGPLLLEMGLVPQASPPPSPPPSSSRRDLAAATPALVLSPPSPHDLTPFPLESRRRPPPPRPS